MMTPVRIIGVSPAALVVRCIAVLCGIAVVLLAYPHIPWWLMLAAALAAFPRTLAPTTLMVGAAVLWLIETDLHPDSLTTARLCGLALALYYLHVSTSLAAVLPSDAHVPSGLLVPWLGRIGVVSVLTVAVAFLVASIESVAGGHSIGTGVWIAELAVGLPLAVGGGLVLIYLGRRR
jgi:hypothetical protein